MRRVGRAGIVLAMAFGVTACPVIPPGYLPPKVVSVDFSPSPAAPGGTVTFDVEVTDDEGVASAVTQLFTTPTGTTLNAVLVCDVEREMLDGATRVRFTVVCPVPSFASNGTWYVKLHVNDGSPQQGYPGTDTQLRFEVAGGTDDRQGPELLSYSTDPAVIDQGTSFTLTMRLRDESFPVSFPGGGGTFWFQKPFGPDSSLQCSRVGFTPVTATEGDLTMSCVPLYFWQPQPVEPGTYQAAPIVLDALHQERRAPMTIEVLPL